MKIDCLIFALNSGDLLKQKMLNVFAQTRKLQYQVSDVSYKSREHSICCVIHISFSGENIPDDEKFFSILYNILNEEKIETFGITTNSSKFMMWDTGIATWGE